MKEVISKLDSFKSEIESKFNVIIWILGIIVTILLAIAGITIFK